MANRKMKQDWSRMKSQIRHMWDDYEFEDTELKQGRRNLKNMVTVIHEKTGEPRGLIRRKLSAAV
ncbi:MAG: hypothetical protein RhofKO_35840 [Rhodothermales bacterium]